MIIRKRQKRQFDSIEAESFEDRLTQFLRVQFADAADAPEGELRSQVAVQISNSRNYGMITEQEIANYVVTAWLLGEDFDTEFPAAHEVLTANIPAAMKADFLEAWTAELFERLESAG